MPEGITAIAVWCSGSWVGCGAYSAAHSTGQHREIGIEAAHWLANLVHEELLEGNGAVRPFLCVGCLGWYWKRGETDD